MVLLRRLFFDALGTLEPAENRWYTYEPTMGSQGAGVLFTNVLGRARTKAGDVTELTPAELKAILDHKLSFHEEAAKTEKASLSFLTCSQTPRTLMLASICLEAPDKFASRMEFLDHHNNGLRDMLDKRGPMYRCQGHLSQLLCDPGPGEVVIKRPAEFREEFLRHFHDESRDDLLNELLGVTTDISSQVFTRFEDMYEDWPLKLFGGYYKREHV